MAMVGSVLAGDSLGIVVHQGLIELDARYPTMKPKPSLMGDIAALLVGIWGGLTLDFPLNILVASTGGYVSTDLWRYFQQRFQEPSVRVVTSPVAVAVAPAKVAYVTQNSVVVKPVATMNQGRYIVS